MYSLDLLRMVQKRRTRCEITIVKVQSYARNLGHGKMCVMQHQVMAAHLLRDARR